MDWPQPLEPVTGPISDARITGAVAGMGEHGPGTAALVQAGYLPPDLVCGMTLFLLARQPREEREPKTASPIAGGVWVREQFTIHRPIDRSDPFTVTGEATGRYVRKGRRYGTTSSRTHDSSGRLVATNLTNGLLAYRVVDGIEDHQEGIPLEQTPGPGPDHDAAVSNPHLNAIQSSTQGTQLGGDELVVSLAMMAARDTSNPDNPIHSDLEAARRAGLAKPIAGGSHVLAFALELLLAEWGPSSIHHGSHFDIRWKAPTEADAAIVPAATISAVTSDRVDVDLEVQLVDGPTAMLGRLTVPLPR